MKAGSKVLFNNLRGGLPTAVRGEGIYIEDSTGRRYIDGIGGMFVCIIGHGVPEVAEAMAAQARTLSFANYVQFTNEPLEELAAHVIDMAPAGIDRAFFVPSGSIANEIALQIAREYHVERGRAGKHRIISQYHNYYGMTVGALSMSGNLATKRRMHMDPYLLRFPHIQPPHCYQCPFGRTYPGCDLFCADELARTLEQENPDTIAAFIATPIVAGTGGAITPPPGYFARIREICDRYDILLIVDEVVTGFGRLGTPFGIDHWGVVPDIMTAAKTLSSGYAAHGATLVHEKIWRTFVGGSRQRLMLLSTFANHPISCAASLAVQRYLAEHDLIRQAADRGRYLKAGLEALARTEPLIGDVRGKGLFLGIELVADRGTRRPFPRSVQLMEKVVFAARQRGLIVSGRFGIGTRVDGDHLSLSPPFVITEGECDEIVTILGESIRQAAGMIDHAGVFDGGAV